MKMVSVEIKVKKEKKTKVFAGSKVVKHKKNKPKKSVAEKALKPKNYVQNPTPAPIIKKKKKYIMPTKSVTNDVVNSCLTAILQLSILHKKKNTILDDESPIFCEISCIKIQSVQTNIKFVLPNSTAASTGEICLIVPDMKKGRRFDHEPTIDHWEELLRKSGVTQVKTILPLRQVKVEYDQFELKRKLLTQHDFIMVDTRILSHASHLLGKMFFKKHNMLIPVRLHGQRDLKKAIEVGLRTVVLRLNIGITSTILLGHTGMPLDTLQENVISFVDQLRTRYPGGEANIRSLALCIPMSIAVPLYLTLRSSNTVNAPKIKKNKPKTFNTIEDELSTIPGSKVTVAPDGTVHVIKPNTQKRKINTVIKEDEEIESENEYSEEIGRAHV